MALAAGTRLGPYEVIAPLGAGGMGEVYRARDTRLGRDVAIKVLPAHLSESSDLRQRFEREARSISRLTHPHICTLYDVGHEGDVDYLVMELLEGRTLADRIEKGPLAADELLRTGIEISAALERAHRAGVVHRDLKPGNVMLTKSGVKLLDFGLAKALEPERAVAGDVSTLPTQAPATGALTAHGTVMGTVPYMAPEQLEGREADARSDVFALGVVLYECAAGKRPFRGDSAASLMSAIIAKEPEPLAAAAPGISRALEHVIRRCLAKDPDDRWQSAADAGGELRWIAEGSGADPHLAPPPGRSRREIAAWIVAAVAVAGFAWALLRPRSAPSPSMVRLALPAPAKGEFGSGLAVSPDGLSIALVAARGGTPQIWVRSLAGVDAHPLPGTEGAVNPFWSPDGRFVAFLSGDKLRKIELSTGAIQTICDVGNVEILGAGSWGRDGYILFNPDSHGPIFRVPAGGGTPTVALALDPAFRDEGFIFPQILPDGRHFLVADFSGDPRQDGVIVASLDSKERTLVVPHAWRAAYTSGHLLYSRGGALATQRFDPSTRRLSGESEAIAEGVGYDVSAVEGVLAYRTGTSEGRQLRWFDRVGRDLGKVGNPWDAYEPSLSPDGRRVAVGVGSWTPVGDVWIVDVERGGITRFTTDPKDDSTPVWSPDASKIVFSSNRNGPFALFVKDASGNGPEDLLWKTDTDVFPQAWSPDGKTLLCVRMDPKTQSDLWAVPIGGGRPSPWLDAPYNEASPQFSPDGRWVAYSSDESGRPEIYVQTFPRSGGKWQVSAQGGDKPIWSADGREIFYLAPDRKLMSAAVAAGAAFSAGAPRPLFDAPVHPDAITESHTQFAVSSDGTRFLVNAISDEARAPITIVLHWNEEKR